MDFGRVEDDELDGIEICFPEIHSEEAPFAKTRLHLGLPLWGSDYFKGVIYPKDTKKADYLYAYASALNDLELNSSYHSLPDKSTVQTWCESVAHNPDFRFHPKLPKVISHEGRLDHHFDLLKIFVETVECFGTHLGTCFLQLSPAFTPMRFPEIVGFLDLWPKDMKLALEVRHLAWFKNTEIREKLRDLLREKKVSWVITDTPGIPDLRHQDITSSEVFIRFVTTGFHARDLKKMQIWSENFKKYSDAGVEDIRFIIHERDEWRVREELEKMIELNPSLVSKSLDPLPQESQQLSLF